MRKTGVTAILLAAGLTLEIFAPWRAASLAATPPAAVAATSTAPSELPAGQESVSQAEGLIRQAREQGVAYLNSKSDATKRATKKSLDDAEKLLKGALKRDTNCEKCMENLVNAYFYQTYFGFSKNYDECITAAGRGLERFPTNSRMVFMKGYAHYNSQEYAEATKAFNRYLAASPGDPQTENQVRQLLRDSQQRFMAGWYRQADFYKSKESRIETCCQNFKMVTLFQVTPEWELSLGSQAFAQITAESPAMQDPEVQQYIENLVTRLVAKTPGPNFNYKVTVLNSPAVNAMTVPGHVFVHTGLLAYAETESELVGVLAHEMAHNYGHHAARRFIKASQAQMLANAIAATVNPQGQVSQLVTQMVSQIGLGLFVLAYSRHEEKEADLYGAHIMYNAGYDPTALSTFFMRMYKANPKQPIKFLSTHPPVPDRATYLIDYLDGFPLGESEMRTNSEEFQKIKAKLLARTPAPQQQRGPGSGVLPPP